jgi:predicted site-specific integrase-resolvase
MISCKNDNILSVKETSEYLKVSIATLSRWRKKNRHVKFIKLGGRCFYKQSEILKFLENNTQNKLAR